MKSLFSLAILAIPLVCLTGCFDFLNPANKPKIATNTVSSITADKFTGVTSATNRISGILLRWPAVTDASLVKSYRVYRITGNTNTLVASLAPSVTSFMDGTVTPGAIYTYQVKAVDRDGLEDANTKTARCLSWAGIDTVVGDSRSSLLVTFKSPAAVVDEVRIYGQLAVGGPKTLLATATGSDDTIEVSSLRTGFSYIISAQAYVASLGKEDGNDLTFTASTYTQGYDTDGASTPQWANVMAVRAFGEAPAAPVHPIVPEKSPNTRVVEIAFNAFSGVGTTATYVVTRAIDGFTLDSSAKVACTDATFTSCRVCDNVTAVNGVVNCRDNAVAASPARYRYSLSLIQRDLTTTDTWAEPLPTDQDTLAQFSILVPIPPKNMTLVQRDATNFEMCSQLNKPSDPANHNRCVYSGVGAVPYSTGHDKPPLNLSNGYYDFGYNLFVDRWEMGCNWTMASQGGMCGPNHTSGDCIGFGTSTGAVGSPQPTQGKVGDVYYWMSTGSVGACYVATSQDVSGAISWKSPNSVITTLGDTAAAYQTMFTNDPGYLDASKKYHTDIPGKRGKTSWGNSVVIGDAVCKSQLDVSYGAKRLSRSREYVAYAAPAIMPAEPYTLGSYTNFMNKIYKSSTFHNSSYNYGCEYGTAADIPPATISQLLDYTNYPAFREMTIIKGTDSVGTVSTFGGINNDGSFMTGAVATIDCQSRYGVQDMMERVLTSDVTYFNKTTFKSTGIMSPFDNGNRDFLSDINGGTTGYVFDLSAFTGGSLTLGSSSLTAVIPTLGLPITTNSYSTNYIPKALITQPYVTQWITPQATVASGSMTTAISGRWYLRMDFGTTNSTLGAGTIRCVLPAE